MSVVKNVGLTLNSVQACIDQPKSPNHLTHQSAYQHAVFLERQDLAVICVAPSLVIFNNGRHYKNDHVETTAPRVLDKRRLRWYKVDQHTDTATADDSPTKAETANEADLRIFLDQAVGGLAGALDTAGSVAFLHADEGRLELLLVVNH